MRRSGSFSTRGGTLAGDEPSRLHAVVAQQGYQGDLRHRGVMVNSTVG